MGAAKGLMLGILSIVLYWIAIFICSLILPENVGAPGAWVIFGVYILLWIIAGAVLNL